MRHPEPLLTKLNTDEIIGRRHGFYGRQDAPFTVIVFGNYSCHACKVGIEMLESWIDKTNIATRLLYRNHIVQVAECENPTLINLELSRTKGTFWRESQRLFNQDVNKLNPTSLYKGTSEELKNVKADLEADYFLTGRIGLKSTPIIYFSTPNGRVYQVLSIEQMENIIERQNFKSQ